MSLVGLTAILVGIGSFCLHATGTFWGELLDVGSMFTISTLFVVLSVRRLGTWAAGELTVLGGSLMAVSIGLLLWFPLSSSFAFGAQLVLAIGVEIALLKRSQRAPTYVWLKAMVACFALAFLSWILDFTKIACDPDNHLVSGHAVWHVLNAASLYCASRYYEQWAPTRRGRERHAESASATATPQEHA